MYILGVSAYLPLIGSLLSGRGQFKDVDILAPLKNASLATKDDTPLSPWFQYCLQRGRISLKEADFVAFHDKPLLLKFEWQLETCIEGSNSLFLLAMGFGAA